MEIKNKNKKRLYVILAITISAIIFSLSYYIGIEKMKGNNKNDKSDKIQVNNLTEESGTMTMQSGGDEKIHPDTSIVFRIRYKKSGDVLIEKVEKGSNFSEKTKNALAEKLKKENYELVEGSSSKVIFLKEIDKYSPNKYVLGIKGDYLAIFKTNSNGDMYIENEEKDITDKKIDNLKEQDINLLTNGSKYFQCNTKEEALARLEDYE
ncbi:hypothetical protein BD780_002988 [Clostridium tetanomorphum]|uniref:Bypass of forespore C C-terminal domain-containing protein n=1 Tax=Clostridium tetanomorphum TaxID=1553 RepID=A0A923E6B6_CLOTT|nr:hypothetical protein [Clostridium tetanomorphum]KAJ53673.1 hypothetical protein CTM_00350 [Clostridium tetanomorphum DSM 665]MBC2397183.1 hypothetical protein [Clostridium tetanomorphum]MBP1862397.1 hypothetical protein [Clostridium tetanomorphum]NRS85763.1 hypothetical protein [Clostridium tetanomorphum]NRZ96228.1 hypothetical protein [Clostridium tetanomorphum]